MRGAMSSAGHEGVRSSGGAGENGKWRKGMVLGIGLLIAGIPAPASALEAASPVRFGGISFSFPTLRGIDGAEGAEPFWTEIRLGTGDILVFGAPGEEGRGKQGLFPLENFKNLPKGHPGTFRSAGEEGLLPVLSGLPSVASGDAGGTLPSFSGGTPAPSSDVGQLPILPGGTPGGGAGAASAGGNPLLAPPRPEALAGSSGGLGTLGGIGQTPVADLAVWKVFDLTTAFGISPTPLGRVEYPGNWNPHVDTFNRTVTFSEDPSGLVSFSIAPGMTVQVFSARDLAVQVASILAANAPDLAVVKEEFREDPSFQGSGVTLSFGRFLLAGTYQGRAVTAMVQTYVLAFQNLSMPFGLGTAVVCTAPREVFDQRLQRYFNRMITSYESSLNKPSKKD